MLSQYSRHPRQGLAAGATKRMAYGRESDRVLRYARQLVQPPANLALDTWVVRVQIEATRTYGLGCGKAHTGQEGRRFRGSHQR